MSDPITQNLDSNTESSVKSSSKSNHQKANPYFKLFANCQLVQGNSQCILYDLQRRTHEAFPVALYQIITQAQTHSIEGLIQNYGEDNRATILEYINYLIDKQYGFLCEEPELVLFPDLNLHWDTSSTISNAILDVDSDMEWTRIEKTFAELEDCLCQNIEIRSHKCTMAFVKKILDYVETSIFHSISFVLRYDMTHTMDALKPLLDNKRINILCIYNCQKKLMEQYNVNESETENNTSKLRLSTKPLETNPNKHINGFFAINMPMFTEAQNHNVYYNRKVYITASGEIYNAPEYKKSFGNIKDKSFTSLKEIVQQEEFQKYWFVSKDKIKVCQDCEYRYMCIDNRLPKQDAGQNSEQEETWAFDTDCVYNPYTGEWSSE